MKDSNSLKIILFTMAFPPYIKSFAQSWLQVENFVALMPKISRYRNFLGVWGWRSWRRCRSGRRRCPPWAVALPSGVDAHSRWAFTDGTGDPPLSPFLPTAWRRTPSGWSTGAACHWVGTAYSSTCIQPGAAQLPAVFLGSSPLELKLPS